MPHVSRRALVDEEPRRVPALPRVLRDQLRRKHVLELGALHPMRTLASMPMEEAAIARARERLERAARGRASLGDVEAALERARKQVQELAQVAAELESSLPGQMQEAIREGVRSEAAPVARQLAEVRGLAGQTIRRLESLENDLIAERHARIDDLALLVDLISSGWSGIDARLARMERKLDTGGSAQIFRFEDREAS